MAEVSITPLVFSYHLDLNIGLERGGEGEGGGRGRGRGEREGGGEEGGGESERGRGRGGGGLKVILMQTIMPYIHYFSHLCTIPDMSDFHMASQPDITGNDVITSHPCHELIKISNRLRGTRIHIQCIFINGQSGNTTCILMHIAILYSSNNNIVFHSGMLLYTMLAT